MKKLSLAFILMMLAILIFSCRKEKDENSIIVDPNFTDFHDTMFTVQWANFGLDYNLDIDKDSVTDVIITAYSYYSSTAGHESYLRVAPKNGYSLAFSEIITTRWHWNPSLVDTIFYVDTVMIPRVYHLNDTIRISDLSNDASMMVYYSSGPSGPFSEYNSGLSYRISETDYYYIALIKSDGISRKIAWLKVKSLSTSGIFINSSNFVVDKDLLKIE
ncbi:MAG: hypothetical protein IPH88_17385 [Bacteroidales bacterium]|nr:hypothetical protein [Bacteroidales bacterium]